MNVSTVSYLSVQDLITDPAISGRAVSRYLSVTVRAIAFKLSISFRNDSVLQNEP